MSRPRRGPKRPERLDFVLVENRLIEAEASAMGNAPAVRGVASRWAFYSVGRIVSSS